VAKTHFLCCSHTSPSFFTSTSQTRAAVVHLNFWAGSTFPVPVCTVPSSMDRTIRCNKVDAVRLYASYRLNLLLLKGQRCVQIYNIFNKFVFLTINTCLLILFYNIVKRYVFIIPQGKQRIEPSPHPHPT